MANVSPYSYGGECQACVDHGVTWITPDGNLIRFCLEHEKIVEDSPGWHKE